MPGVEATLREVVSALAPIERPPCSPGERQAAEWLADRFTRAGCTDVRLEEEAAYPRYLDTIAGIGVLAGVGAVLIMRGRRVGGTALTVLAAAAVTDEAQNGPRVVRRLLRRRATATNVVAVAGDPQAQRTLVVHAHHDAHWTGQLYDQGLHRLVFRVAPWVVDRAKRSFPQWWMGFAGPLLAIAGRPRAGLALNAAVTALVVDAARSPVSPGANDNLSGVAGLVGLAEMLRDQPVDGVRVLLVSCGAEEALQEGVRAFMRRHRDRLDPATTSFLNLETIGSPRLLMLEGEGPIWMEHYAGPAFRDAVERCAADAGVALDRGFYARASTDSILPSRAGFPVATLTSVTPWGALANYHLPSDTPENVDYRTVGEALRLAYAVAGSVALRGR